MPTTGVQNHGYSWKVAFTYIFNLLFGMGALALPKAFAETGIVLGSVTLVVLVLMSYCASTFMIEVMAIVNAIQRHQGAHKPSHESVGETRGCESSDEEADENAGLLIRKTSTYAPLTVSDINEKMDRRGDYEEILGENHAEMDDHPYCDNELFEITSKVQVGDMANLLFNKVGVILFYSVTCLSFYGALAIYATGISKCLTAVICGDTDVFEGNVHQSCPRVPHISIFGIYYCMLALVALGLGPFTFGHMSSAKVIQVFTTMFRWMSFAAMLILSILKISENKTAVHLKLFNIRGLSNFFGIGLMSLMCQDALPSILINMKDKNKFHRVILLDFVSVFFCLIFLVLTAAFAFGDGALQDVYTLNFSHPTFLKYVLQLFPVFTLSASFPTIAITLRENLKIMFLRGESEEKYGFVVRKLFFPLVTLLPPLVISFLTFDVEMLVSITGAYPCAIIQYLFPALFVFLARRKLRNVVGGSRVNKYGSTFGHNYWVVVMLGIYALSLVFVTINFIL